MTFPTIHEYLTSSYSHLEPHQVLGAPPSAILGVGPAAEDVLAELEVKTVFDLAMSRLFAAAGDLALAAPNRFTHRYGKPAADTVDGDHESTEIARFAAADVEVLAGVGQRNGPRLKEALHVQTVRDLALWPPYLAARDIAARLLSPESVTEAAGVPADLLPRSGEYPTERVFYQSLVVGDELTDATRNPVADAGAATDIAEAGAFDPLEALHAGTGYTTPAVGACLSFSQSWYTQGVTLGQLLHSVALAPGESTRIAMIDWSRQSSGQQLSTDEQAEALSHTVGRNRAISEVVNSVATETQSGDSETNVRSTSHTLGVAAAAGGAGFGATASYGMSTTAGRTWGHTTSAGRREVGAQMTQSVVDRTHQAANVARNRRASVVREVSEQESEAVSTRVVANYNHMHALSVQYYEVVQAYRVLTRLERADRCLFLPMKLLDFSDPGVLNRVRSVLAGAALQPSVARELAAGVDTVVVRGASPVAHGHGYTDASTARAEQNLGRPVRLSADTSALPVGTRFWFGSATAGVTITQVEGIRHVGDRKVLRYEPGGQQYGGDYAGDWPAEPIPELHEGFPVADLSQFKTLRVHIAPSEGDWAAAGVVELSCSFWVPTGDRRSNAALSYRTVRPAGRSAVVEFELSGGALATGRLLDHLGNNAYHYSQAVWQSLDAAVLSSMLENYTMNGKPLSRLLDFKPLGTSGNYLVFRLADGEDDPAWQGWLTRHGIRIGHVETNVVPLPSGGVFAEAVLGRANSAEKIDLTRFWDWQVSPPPLTAPEIAPIDTGSRHQNEPLEHVAGAQPTLNIINPPAAPDPLAVGAALAALGNGTLFRDMSGAEALSTLAGQATTNSLAAAAATASLAARRNATELGGLANLGRDMDQRAQNEQPQGTRPAARPRTGSPVVGTAGPAADGERTASMERTLVLGAAGLGATDAMASAVQPVVYDREDVDAALQIGPRYADLLAFAVPQAVLTTLDSRSMRVQRFDDAIGDLNLDLYPVTVTKMPTVDGVEMDAPALLRHVRLHIADFVDKTNSEFSPYSTEDRDRWISDEPVGTVFKIDIVALDNAAVVASLVEQDRWRFTTISTPETGGHPVSGHREWGYRISDANAHVFYTRGADRSTRAPETLLAPITFAGADNLWLGFQDRLASFINRHGGTAVKMERFSRQFEWTPFRQLLNLPISI
jgi:hypothetical protein